LYGNAKKTWIIIFLFKEFMFFFNKSIPGGVSFNKKHLLILNGHGSHVTLKTIEHVKIFELDMIALPSHIQNALQPFNVFYLKSSKITFKKVRNATMSKTNHMELNNIILIK
jgi:hypothetical protein